MVGDGVQVEGLASERGGSLSKMTYPVTYQASMLPITARRLGNPVEKMT